MSSRLGPLVPLTLAGGLVLALVACSSDNPQPAGESGAATSLASSSSPAGSLGSSGATAQVPVGTTGQQPKRGRIEVVRTLDHDPSLFTQGLQVDGDQIFESTGMYGQSLVQRRPLAGGAPSASVPLQANQFGEGLAVTPDTVWSLTWKDGIAYQRDRDTLEARSTVSYSGEGWGLCYNGSGLVMSDGSNVLTTRDAATFEPTGNIQVTAGGAPVTQLNELECADGSILANVWMTNDIVRIDPSTGAVTAIYDASALEQPRPSNPDAVLNGIAAVPNSDTVLLTGKLWPTLYEVRLVD